jgi:hypothetical protein
MVIETHYYDDDSAPRQRGRGWWNMRCWNGLSADQQRRLIEVGNLPFGYEPGGTCQRGAAIAIETQDDEAPGPRFYCGPCAHDYLEVR